MRLGSLNDTDPGDDSVVMRLYASWAPNVAEVMGGTGEPSCHVIRQRTGEWELFFAVQRGERVRQRHIVSVDPDGTRKDRWHFAKLAPGVWDLPTSIVVPGQFHGFVTLLGVPDPAPWEPG